MNEEKTVTHAAIPIETYRALEQLLNQLPHGQVRGIIDKLAETVRGVAIPEVAPEEE